MRRLRPKPLCAHSRKILARQRAGKAHRTQPKHKQAVRNDVFHVAVFNAHVDDICHQQRHKQFQNGLRQLEQRPQNELPAVTVKIAEQCFQTFTSLFSEAVFIHSYFITALPIFKKWIFFFPKLRNQALLPRYENDVFFRHTAMHGAPQGGKESDRCIKYCLWRTTPPLPRVLERQLGKMGL